jgi:hypothetical protein
VNENLTLLFLHDTLLLLFIIIKHNSNSLPVGSNKINTSRRSSRRGILQTITNLILSLYDQQKIIMNSWYHYIPDDHHRDTANANVNSVSGKQQQQQQQSSTTTSNNENNINTVQQKQDCFRRRRSLSSPLSLEASANSSSISVILPEKYDPSSLEILRSLSSGSPMQAVSNSHSSDHPDYNNSCEGSAFRHQIGGDVASEPTQTIPRRNLTEAFEELYVQPPNTAASSSKDTETPIVKQSNPSKGGDSDNSVTISMISPTGVMDLDCAVQQHHSQQADRDGATIVGKKLDEKLGFCLHPALQRDLSDALVERVSFYAIIHDINKEATAMASNDDSGYDKQQQQPQGGEDLTSTGEEYDPLVVAVNGHPSSLHNNNNGKAVIGAASSLVNAALIDEEQWLLDAIDARSFDETRSINACPATFPEAMGERDYENPLASLSNGSRTQLWKPSRSWWEAKSGKNPWIEPKCHNKRWR